MKKIPSLFQRNYQGDRLVRDEVVPGSEWVIAGEGEATQKYDGTCCLIKDGRLFKRYEVKRGRKAPLDFTPACEVDPVTGKQQGWVPVGDGPEDRWHREAFERSTWHWEDGTYELMGPKVQGNPENVDFHILAPHAYAALILDCPRSFLGLKVWLADHNIEGIVWHHPDGRMVKIKARDFGIKRRSTQSGDNLL